MAGLHGKKIILGISGGIAAYKCAELTRRLKEQGAQVRVVMTNGAKAFITPLTMQAVSGEPVSDDLLDPAAEAAMGHIELAKWAELILIAPASADVIARVAHGFANDLLSTLVLATDAPVALAPAMNQQMYKAPATQTNLDLLNTRGFLLWGPNAGDQACGDVGPGRMKEPHELLHEIQQHFQPSAQPLAGISVCITAGPTREALDPVRYITNHSSGKMGFALAKAAADLGAKVDLIAGPVQLPTPANVTRVNVQSACEMYKAALEQAQQSDIFIGCAAVADYRAADVQSQKIKKSSDTLSIELVKNPDIIAEVAALTSKRPYTIGFAAETQDVAQYAKDKLKRKNLDLICANNVAIQGQGFNADENALTIYWQDGEEDLPLAAKSTLAQTLIAFIYQKYQQTT